MIILHWSIILTYSQKFTCDAFLIAAIILAESNGNPNIINQNDNTQHYLDVKKYALINNYSTEVEKWGQGCSWGLGQITGVVAREHGFKDNFSLLLKPSQNIKYVSKHIALLQKKYKNQNDVIASYNAGSPIKKNKKYINQKYVNRVNRWLKRLKNN